MKKYTFLALVKKITTMSDASLDITISTREMNDDDAARVLSFRKKECHVFLAEKEKDLEDISIPDVKMEFKNAKTPSERYRNILYIKWEQTSQVIPFDTFYKDEMERQINLIKDELE